MPRPTGEGSEKKLVLAIGERVLVAAGNGGGRTIALLDDKGAPSGGSVRVGSEVEVIAWRPQRASGTRYRIRDVAGTEGWIDAGCVQRRPKPAPVPVVRPASLTPPPKPTKPVKAKPAAASAPKVAAPAVAKTRPPAAPAKPVAAPAAKKGTARVAAKRPPARPVKAPAKASGKAARSRGKRR